MPYGTKTMIPALVSHENELAPNMHPTCDGDHNGGDGRCGALLMVSRLRWRQLGCISSVVFRAMALRSWRRTQADLVCARTA